MKQAYGLKLVSETNYIHKVSRLTFQLRFRNVFPAITYYKIRCIFMNMSSLISIKSRDTVSERCVR